MRLFLIMMMMVLNFISFSWADEDQVAGGKCLKIVWEGKDSQIEVGSHFVGAEFHKSAIRPNRISFFYPVVTASTSAEIIGNAGTTQYCN